MLTEAVIGRARAYLGEREDPPGSNWGDFVAHCLAHVSIHFPAPWCVAFVMRVVDEACAELHLANPLPRSGHALTLWKHAEDAYRVTEPHPGALCFFEHLGADGQPDGHGHACIVEDVRGDLVTTIDGNSDAQGSRTGGSVVRLTWGYRDGRRGHSLKVLGYLVLESQI